MEVLIARPRPCDPAGDERRVGEAGFSLVELLVAILVVAFVVLGVLTAFGQGVKFNSSSRDYTAVSNLAKSQLEELIALPYDTTGAAGDPLSVGDHGPVTSPDGRFSIRYAVFESAITTQQRDPATALTIAAPAGMGNIKRITLTVVPLNDTAPGLREVTVEGVKHVR
jgi:prepilin-type N-terminal cleavage/methylation domain-containing protein